MVYPTVFLIHSATLNSRRQNFTLGYDTGTAVFHAGATLTGATSHATAIIVSTGSIASGSLQVHTITGTFLNDEAISDNGTVPGAAVVNGVIAEAFNSATGELGVHRHQCYNCVPVHPWEHSGKGWASNCRIPECCSPANDHHSCDGGYSGCNGDRVHWHVYPIDRPETDL